MAARFEHQSLPDPVEFPHKMQPAFHHGVTGKKWAATGDQAAIKAQFGELGKACKSCHDKYREEE